MYGEKLSVAGFFGSIPDIVSDDGDHQYTIDKKKAYAEFPTPVPSPCRTASAAGSATT